MSILALAHVRMLEAELAAARDYVARAAVGNIDRARMPLTQREWLERFERQEEQVRLLREALTTLTNAPQANPLVMIAWARILDEAYDHGVFGGQVLLLSEAFDIARAALAAARAGEQAEVDLPHLGTDEFAPREQT